VFKSTRKILATAARAALIVLAVVLMPAAASAQRRDMDCENFSSQKSAQIFFLKHGGPRYDPDRLDADHDGIACEDNPAPYYYGKRLP
jgi:excalibur calcium-binding domain-containing protein